MSMVLSIPPGGTWHPAAPTRSPHLRLLQPIIRNSERKRRLGVNLAPIKFHIFYQVRFWYPLETNVYKVFMTIY